MFLCSVRTLEAVPLIGGRNDTRSDTPSELRETNGTHRRRHRPGPSKKKGYCFIRLFVRSFIHSYSVLSLCLKLKMNMTLIE